MSSSSEKENIFNSSPSKAPRSLKRRREAEETVTLDRIMGVLEVESQKRADHEKKMERMLTEALEEIQATRQAVQLISDD
jgi:hypothetical protein